MLVIATANLPFSTLNLPRRESDLGFRLTAACRLAFLLSTSRLTNPASSNSRRRASLPIALRSCAVARAHWLAYPTRSCFVKDHTHIGSRRLQYESLEPREVMAAGVTAALKSGVLTVNATDGNDTVKFYQKNGAIYVSNIGGYFAASAVSKIVVNVNKGNDVVSFASLSNGGNQGIAEAITVNSGPGSSRVRLADGHDATFSGAGHVVTIATNGTAALDGRALSWPAPTPPAPTPPAPPAPAPPPANWFDANVVDAALRSLGRTLYADGVLSRSDVISLLRSAEDGNVVDATELSDLNKVVGYSTFFASNDYLGKITSYVVSGNTANAKFQGAASATLPRGRRERNSKT